MGCMKVLVLCVVLGYICLSSCAITADTASLAFSDDTTIVSCVGALQTEGDLLVRSNGIREVFGSSGRSIKVGVIANGVESLELS